MPLRPFPLLTGRPNMQIVGGFEGRREGVDWFVQRYLKSGKGEKPPGAARPLPGGSEHPASTQGEGELERFRAVCSS